jgi:hypothetical protein
MALSTLPCATALACNYIRESLQSTATVIETIPHLAQFSSLPAHARKGVFRVAVEILRFRLKNWLLAEYWCMRIERLGGNKVTIRPGFPGKVPIFEGLSRENYDVARDAHLSRFLCCVPLLSRVRSSFTSRVP